ncbi:hypothetical protein Daus18300_000050 [Diaporthe australafricana]|uniref:Uncharacterized protein n=1 Tax=Diaporthe australafricana TaxID=127596 RepID=A0ABR3Y7X8_9PEZI
MLYDLKEHLPIGGYQEDDHVQSAIFADDEEEEEEKATKSLFGSVRHHRSKAGTPAAGLNDGRKSSAPVILKEMSKSSKKFFDKLTAKKEPEYYHLSVAIIGDRHCGKGTLLSHYTLDSHIDGTVHQPDVNTFSIQLTGLLTVDNFTTRMEIVDIVHQNVHAGNVHPLSLKKYDVVIICVDIGNQRNLESVTKWRMEIERHCPAVPRVLLGLKADLRPNFPTLRLCFLKESIASTVEQGEKAARENNAAAYYECSAQTGEGVTAFFESLARFSVQTIRNHNN